MKPKSKSKGELATAYGVGIILMRKWLKSIPDLNVTPQQKMLTPKQVAKVYDFLGEP